METYRNVEINFSESAEFTEENMGETYTVTAGGAGLVFRASSRYGKSYGTTPKAAVDGARTQIDTALDRKNERA